MPDTSGSWTPPVPEGVIAIGVTGHRTGHPAWKGNAARIEQALAGIFVTLDGLRVRQDGPPVEVRLLALLAEGTDRTAARMGLDRGYRLIVPLPFESDLNAEINALGGYRPEPLAEPEFERLLADASVFALADRDAQIRTLLDRHRSDPDDMRTRALFDAEVSHRVALAGRVMIEQSDVLVAVWDGETTALAGGTGDTVAAALAEGCPVIRIDPARPDSLEVMRSLEMLTHGTTSARSAAPVEAILADAIAAASSDAFGNSLARERWKERSRIRVHSYRRVEALFGSHRLSQRFRSLTQFYETPAAIAEGTAAPMLDSIGSLPGGDPDLKGRIEASILPRFAWADGISAYLSDAYRSGMTISFVLSSLAIVGGLSYLPFVSVERKWIFALFELVLLSAIIAITWLGRRGRWHGRWFETRRAAEYLRFAPVLVVFGVARARGRWPRGPGHGWPEFYARQVIREVGLPEMTVTPQYLRAAVSTVLLPFVEAQRSYHEAKAERLATVHHRLDRLSEGLFKLAVAVVAIYLVLHIGMEAGVLRQDWLAKAAKWFTVLGVAAPTFGAAIAGIRYFGDFERFSAISRVTADKLAGIRERIEMLLERAREDLTYEHAAALVHATDEVVFSEIESWQGVFSVKRIAVPV